MSHWRVLERIDGPFGALHACCEVRIETGRTHQIRVHVQSMGHPVVGDTLYGAPHLIKQAGGGEPMELDRNFLHAAELEFLHPRTKQRLGAARLERCRTELTGRAGHLAGLRERNINDARDTKVSPRHMR